MKFDASCCHFHFLAFNATTEALRKPYLTKEVLMNRPEDRSVTSFILANNFILSA